MTPRINRVQAVGSVCVGGVQFSGMAIGRTSKGSNMIAACRNRCLEIPSHFRDRCEYRYPANKSVWKNTMAAFQTAGDPPRLGNKIRTTIGWTTNSKAEPRKAAAIKMRPVKVRRKWARADSHHHCRENHIGAAISFGLSGCDEKAVPRICLQTGHP